MYFLKVLEFFSSMSEREYGTTKKYERSLIKHFAIARAGCHNLVRRLICGANEEPVQRLLKIQESKYFTLLGNKLPFDKFASWKDVSSEYKLTIGL
jgi:hypothetical protein